MTDPVKQPNPRYNVTPSSASPDDDGNFEIRLRLLGNEVFAISIAADPLNKKWVGWGMVIALVTVVGLSFLGEPLASFYNTLIGSEQHSPQ